MMSSTQKHKVIVTSLLGPGENPDEPIDAGDLKARLDDRVPGKGFDSNIYEQLVDRATKRGPLTISAFADTWIEGERRLQETIDSFKLNQSPILQQIQEAQNKKIEAEATERLNAMNIMDGSQLFVTVHNIQNIRRRDGTPIEADFLLSCENLSVNTGTSTDPDNFVVNKNYTFPIRMGNQPLDIQMVDMGSQDQVSVGAIRILLNSLASQETIPISQPFKASDNDVLDTVINMDCRWAYSNVKYYDTVIMKAQESLRGMDSDRVTSENFIVDMAAPFPELSRTLARSAPTQKAAMAAPARPVATYVADEKPWNKLPTTSNPTTTKFLIYSLYAYLAVAFLASFNHCVFLDLTIALILFGSVQLNTPLLIQSLATKAIGGIALAILLGVVWLAFYIRPWWNTGYIDNFSQLSVRRYSVVFEFVLMIARLVALYALVFSYKTLQIGQDEFAF